MAVLLSAGAHVPVIPLLDVVGSGANIVPVHTGDTGVNTGVTELTVTVAALAVVLVQPVMVKLY